MISLLDLSPAGKVIMPARVEQTEFRPVFEACAIAVLYEDLTVRERAIQVGDALVQRFVGDLEFNFTWWRFDYLGDPEVAREAAQAAARADLILIVLSPENSSEHIPVPVKAWFEQWLPRRATAEGALAVVGPATNPERSSGIDPYLRLAAERGHMDYLPLFDAAGSPSELEARLHKGEFSSDRTDPPCYSSGWGINE